MSKLKVKRGLVLTLATAQYIVEGDRWGEYYLDFVGPGFAAALGSPNVTDLELRTLLLALDIIAREDTSKRRLFERNLLMDAALRRIADRSNGDPGYSGVAYGG